MNLAIRVCGLMVSVFISPTIQMVPVRQLPSKVISLIAQVFIRPKILSMDLLYSASHIQFCQLILITQDWNGTSSLVHQLVKEFVPATISSYTLACPQQTRITSL